MADFGSPVSIQSLTSAIEFYRRSQSGAAGVDFADVIERMQAGEFGDPLVIGRDDERQQQDEYQPETSEREDEQVQGKLAERNQTISVSSGQARVAESYWPTGSEPDQPAPGPSSTGQDVPTPLPTRGELKGQEQLSAPSEATLPFPGPMSETSSDTSELHLLDRLQELQQIGLTQLFALLETAKSPQEPPQKMLGRSIAR